MGIENLCRAQKIQGDKHWYCVGARAHIGDHRAADNTTWPREFDSTPTAGVIPPAPTVCGVRSPAGGWVCHKSPAHTGEHESLSGTVRWGHDPGIVPLPDPVPEPDEEEVPRTVTVDAPVMAIGTAKNNAELILGCKRLGYLDDEYEILDPTYGYGGFWKLWMPPFLFAHDIEGAKAPSGVEDFTNLRYKNDRFDAVVFDPPYKLNGTPSGSMDERYGVHVVRTWQDRHRLIEDGIVECIRVLKPEGFLLLKCQDQVCSGKVRWQTRLFADWAEEHGVDLIDRMDLLAYRPQPAGRRQVHARRNHSTLLVFRKWK